jgi:hypothetical protein
MGGNPLSSATTVNGRLKHANSDKNFILNSFGVHIMFDRLGSGVWDVVISFVSESDLAEVNRC